MDYVITKGNMTYRCTTDILEHHGIKGQKWGIRRYQNPDGSLTSAGRRRYRNDPERYKKDLAATESRESAVAKINAREREIKDIQKRYRKEAKEYNKNRKLAARAVGTILAGPFANTLYSDYMASENSAEVAKNRLIYSILQGNTGISNYQLQKTRQLIRATAEYDEKHPGFDLMELQKQKMKAEQDFKQKSNRG